MTLDTEIKRRLTPKEMEKAFAIRAEVFVREQGIPAELDLDGKDQLAHHVLVCSAGHGVATGRVLVSQSGEAELARIAVLPDYRGHGLGRMVVAELEAIAFHFGATLFRLHPHRHLERFYEDLGYTTVPGIDFVGGHELITMTKPANLHLYPPARVRRCEGLKPRRPPRVQSSGKRRWVRCIAGRSRELVRRHS